VEVELDRAKGMARLTVRDHGPGVPEEALGEIFQPFVRVDDSRDSSTGGVGLGLAIAMRAVGLHHGRVWAENARPGLRVLIELPLDRVARDQG
jgi:two-component system sensor histidine kinase CpxA